MLRQNGGWMVHALTRPQSLNTDSWAYQPLPKKNHQRVAYEKPSPNSSSYPESPLDIILWSLANPLL